MSTWPGEGRAVGLGAALLFGLSTPVAKLLLPGSGPLTTAGLLYVGAGLGLLAVEPLRRRREAPLRRADAAPLAAVVLAGGVAGPALLMWGLGRMPGASASLLLNLEAPLTIALAVLVFRESMGGAELVGAAAVLAGAATLGLEGGFGSVPTLGALAVAGACLAWAVDNNLSQRLTLRDPVAIARLKALAAGPVSLALALAAGERPPGAAAVAAALATGFVGYGVSLVLHLRAMRALGAARQAALFSTAPFAGAAAAVPLLGERPSLRAAGAGLAMAAGVVVLMRARHAHAHAHAPLEHEHLHEHDEHHRHDHAEGTQGGEPHSHAHVHPPVTHEHPHASDAHHLHRH